MIKFPKNNYFKCYEQVKEISKHFSLFLKVLEEMGDILVTDYNMKISGDKTNVLAVTSVAYGAPLPGDAAW